VFFRWAAEDAILWLGRFPGLVTDGEVPGLFGLERSPPERRQAPRLPQSSQPNETGDV